MATKDKNRRITQIVTGDVHDTFEHGNGATGIRSRNTLFVLTDDGQIWTRAYREGRYREWFSLHNDIETQP